MTTFINASASSGLVQTADTSAILGLQTNGTTALTIDTSANVGIGTTSPSAKLHVESSSVADLTEILKSTDAVNGRSVIYMASAKNSAGTQSNVSMEAQSVSGANADLVFRTGGSNVTAGSERMRIDSSGNVGIGTSSPTSKFDVLGSGTTYSYLRNSTTTALTAVDSSTAYFGSGTNSPVVFQVNNGEKMRINSSGYVGIGTTSPETKVQVEGTADTVGATLRITSTGVCSAGMAVNATGLFFAADTGGFVWKTGAQNLPTTTGTERMRMDSSGNLLMSTARSSARGIVDIPTVGGSSSVCLGISRGGDAGTMVNFYSTNSSTTVIGSIGNSSNTNTTYNTSSDYRLKENIVPMVGALDAVSALKPVTWKWKSNGVDGQGFIAHELAEVVPDCVTGEKDAVDADGNPVYQGVDTSYLVATLTKAIQELKAINDQQAETINALTARVVALEGQ